MVVVHGGGGGGCMPINATSPLLQNLLKRRPMLVLDMDETLIHTPRTMLAGGGAAIGKTIPRPGLHMFLQAVVDIYEIVIFTAATKPYADPILDRIEKDGGVKYFPRRLYREHCSIRGSMMTKDMRRIPGCDVKRAIIIDNLRQNFMLQPRSE
jgi:TFIIF-interacting CTD phosphatase-like protein